MKRSLKAIIVVSFGTSYEETRKKTIDQIEMEIQRANPDSRVYRAWTSGMICRKIKKRDGIHIMNVAQAMEQVLTDGCYSVTVQPTHVINGIEYEAMVEAVLSCKEQFDEIRIGTPLLTTMEDQCQMAEAVAETLHPEKQEALILMGHGTEHSANAIYNEMDLRFKILGYDNIFMGTVEAFPSIETLLDKMNQIRPERIILAPFMIVAGDHALHDLAGEDEDSWKSRFEAAGYNVTCVLKGLGEFPKVRKLFLSHAAKAERI